MKILFILFFFVSCAKISYVAEQGLGQIALEYDDIDNIDFLNDPKQNQKFKEKIRVIENAKNYFFNYFALEQNNIYDEVKILNQKAVTYLVIHSPPNEIKAIETSFPIVGRFPYLGFFSVDSAKNYKEEKEKENFHTYMRPVYAYSTLNHYLWPFDDNILSSFFYFKDKDLTELIFHELVHTILFVGDNVSFNENLAQFIAKKLAIDFYKYSKKEQQKLKDLKKKNRKLLQLIVQKSKELNAKYKKQPKKFEMVLNKFLVNDFTPSIKRLCSQIEIKKCWPLKETWNNARFAALGTYEAKQDKMNEVFKLYDLPLKEFVIELIKKEKNYNNKKDFLTYLKESK